MFKKCFLPYFIMFGEKAQISIELIIVLAAVVAIVLLLVSQLQKTAEKGTKVFDKKTNLIFKEIEDI
tara:strand:+ start:9232 stop:9432 length:201 start_codon:yes stop_codon:yes gene_type:complete